jgi:mRNA interferase RelE/StbE
MTYTIEFSNKAEKQFKSLPPQTQERLQPKIDALAQEPRPRGAIELSDVEEDTYRIRVGDYRILYEISDRVLLVWVVEVGHRREIYRQR